MKIPAGLESILSIDPEIMHGSLCFSGTRVPLAVLLDNLDEGMSLEDFARNYPSVSSDQIDAVIFWENQQLRVAAGLDLAG